MAKVDPGNSARTAWARTCADEWRRMWSPSSSERVTTANSASSVMGRSRSTSAPLSRTATAASARRGPMDLATSSPVTPSSWETTVPSGYVSLTANLSAR